jgi:hypothetical protein
MDRGKKRRWWTWVGLAAVLGLLAGCAGLCTKHLYLFREGPQKQPPEQVALVITDPNIIQAIMPGANLNLQGAVWAPQQPSQPNEVYRLAILTVDGKQVYQGMCMDNLTVDMVELRPGARSIAVRVDRYGPWGMEKLSGTVQFDLQPSRVYFLRPDWQELLSKRLVIKPETLPEVYNSTLRARVIDRQRQTQKSASLD